MKCGAHGEAYSGLCNWCGTQVCDSCIDDAGGKRYCTGCNSKSRAPRMSHDDTAWGSAPTKKISNVDESLNESTLKEAKQMVTRRIR